MPPLQSFTSFSYRTNLVTLMLMLIASTCFASASASASATAKTADTFRIDTSDPRFKAVADEIDRRIISSLENIVAGLQQSRDALRGLQQASTVGTSAAALQDPKLLQNKISRALDKVETVLHGRTSTSSSICRGKGEATVVEMDVDMDMEGTKNMKSKDTGNCRSMENDDDILAENWVALSLGSSNNTVTTAAATLSTS